MKDSLTIAVSLAALAVFIFVASQINQPKPPPPILTPAVLDCDPDLWLDQTVRVKTAGFERDENGHDCIFRQFANKPAIVVLHFKSDVPEKLPDTITGICRGRKGPSVVVEDCQ